MLARCGNPKAKKYPYYGAKGVRVCRRWQRFENFLADMGTRPDGLQLDRWPDPNGDYKLSNCRWATHSQQQKNKRNTKRYGADQLTLVELAQREGISKQLVWYHLKVGHEYA